MGGIQESDAEKSEVDAGGTKLRNQKERDKHKEEEKKDAWGRGGGTEKPSTEGKAPDSIKKSNNIRRIRPKRKS